MALLARTAVTPVWVGLVLASVLSWWLGTDHSIDDNRELTTSLIVIVAFAKVWFVGAYFMELRHAPGWLKAAFEAWTTVVCAVILGIYFVS